MDFDYIVVGRGLTGAAAARHLTTQGYGVALVGPGEPDNWQTHQGVFASHYDEGRITRIIDPNLDWARFAQRSIHRYRPLEQQTGLSFYGEVGHLAVGEPAGESGQYLQRLHQVAIALQVPVEWLDRAALAQRFPYWRFPDRAVGLWQGQQAGYVSPRGQVAAQTRAVALNGGVIVDDLAVAVRSEGQRVRVETSSTSLTARGAIVATGGFTRACGLLPEALPFWVQGHTVLLAEVAPADLPRLAAMPSLIFKPEDRTHHAYLLPPIAYPDGRWYIKIGGSNIPPIAADLSTLQRWFKGTGETAVAHHLQTQLGQLLPDWTPVRCQAIPCVSTHTASGYPLITPLEDSSIVTLVGCNGYAGKSADELGYIAAQRLSQPTWTYDLPEHRFRG